MKAILEANGKPLAFSSVDEVPLVLLGCRASILIGSRTRDGLRVPVVASIQGRRPRLIRTTKRPNRPEPLQQSTAGRGAITPAVPPFT